MVMQHVLKSPSSTLPILCYSTQTVVCSCPHREQCCITLFRGLDRERLPAFFFSGTGFSHGRPLSSRDCSISKACPGSSFSMSSGTPQPGPFTAASINRACTCSVVFEPVCDPHSYCRHDPYLCLAGHGDSIILTKKCAASNIILGDTKTGLRGAEQHHERT